MSIRLRLTLLYSGILTLTLILFGTVLYTIQSQSTLNSLKQDISHSSTKYVEATRRSILLNSRPPDTDPAENSSSDTESAGENLPRPTGGPLPFSQFSNDQAFQVSSEREIARILGRDGTLLASPFGRSEDALPLSEIGLQALLNQEDWWETGTLSGEKMLIYSQPIVRDGQTVLIVQVARSLAEREHSLRSLAIIMGGTGLLMIFAAFGVGWMLSGVTLQAIHRITNTAEEIGEKSDFTRRVEYAGPQDEIGQLASTFNAMLTRLQEAYQKVEHSLEMQRNFVADVSHELRTPLTTLRGNLGLLRRDPPAPPEDQADILNDMVEESDRLIRLVNDLLMMAWADTGRKLNIEALEIQPILDEACRQMGLLDANRQIFLRSTPDLVIHGERDAFKQVILILLDNAHKHSENDIVVIAEQDDAQVVVMVRDYGSGISAEKMERIFDRFYRGENSSISSGYGLGLPIARALVEGMDGKIEIKSEPGMGSIITLRFPKK